MARKKPKGPTPGAGNGPLPNNRDRSETLDLPGDARPMGGIFDASNTKGPADGGPGVLDLIESMKNLTQVYNRVIDLGSAAAPTQIGNPSPQFGQNALGMASGFGSSPAPPPPPSALVAGNASSRFIESQSAGGNAPGLAGAMGMGSGAGASGVNFAAKAVGDFADRIGQKIGQSGLEVSGSQIAKENLDPGRFVESALGTAASAGVPGAAGLQGVVTKLNNDSDARSGRTALQSARTRLADIAGGLAQRGAHFTDSQLLQARNVLQERAQRDVDVRLQIRNLEDATGAQRSGLGSGGHAR